MIYSNHKPFFSIVIPVYNRAEIIDKVLESCLKQTFQDFEIIVVDDGSTDSLKAKLDKFHDERIHYIRQENGGGSTARNTGIDASSGEYIAFLDSDDFFLKDKLQKCHQTLENQDCDCLYSQVYLDRGVGKYWIKPPRAIAPNENMADYLLRDRGWVPTSTFVIKRKLAVKVRYRETLVSGDDTDFSIRLFNQGANFKMINEPLVICSDFNDPGRISFTRNYFEQLKWTEELKQIVPSKAYYGYRGWHLAKMRTESSYGKAFLLYLDALRQGAYSPKLALIIFFQIFSPKVLYRKVANFIAVMMGKVRNQESSPYRILQKILR
jgi:glycosyltransferase involved in cell wall biosynthesis